MLDLALIQSVPPPEELALQGLLFLVLLGLSAFMSGSEIALLSLSRLRRMQLVEEQHPRIAAVETLLDRPERLLISVLVMDTLLNVSATVLVARLTARIFDSYIAAIAIGVSTFLLLTFGEVVPKAFAARHNEKWALAVAPFLVFMERALLPIVLAYERVNDSLFHGTRAEEEAARTVFRSEEEIKTLITMGAEEGILEEKEEDMLHSVIEFAATTAREIMVPRIDMTAVTGDATLDQVRAFILESGFSRIPVYQGTVDNVVGVLYVKDMLMHYVEKRPMMQVKELMREPFFVPESKKLNDLLAEMREKRVHMAIVIDEFGGTAGMVTMEDVIEEIVGDIFDESDLRSEAVRKLDNVTAVVDARTHVADANRALELDIPEDEGFDTVAGYVYHKLGRLGKEGEIVHGPGFDMVVEKVTNRRILRVRFVKHTPAPPEDEASGEIAP